MEDEAEVQLLEQHLLKTRQISQRMTSILGKFETRLVKLEKSVAPLHDTTQILTRRFKNIEATLSSIDKLSSQQEGVAMEEALILRGPRPEDLRVYTDAIDKLNANIAFQSSEQAAKDSARLVETGSKKLTQLYTKLVAEASIGSPPLHLSAPTSTLPPELHSNSFTASAPFDQSIISTLGLLVAALRKLPVPATHPSHPAAVSISITLKDAQKGYADMRGSWSKKCLEGGVRRVMEGLESSSSEDSADAAEAFVAWVKELIAVSDMEYERLVSLAAIPSPPALAQTYSKLLSPILNLFSSTLASLTSLIKKDLPKYTFLALATYSTIQSLQSNWERVIASRMDRGGAELKDGLNALRSICLRSFPEVLVDVQTAALAGTGEVGTSVAPITSSIAKYLNQLPEVLPAVTASLQTLGDGNWKMGQGVGKGGKGAGSTDETVLLEHFTYDIVTATLTSLSTLSKTHKRPVLSSIFLLNNISHLRLHLLANPQSNIDELLSKPTRDALNSGFRTAKAEYFSANFMPLVQCLADDPKESKGSTLGGVVGGGSGKSALKEKWMRFWDALDELVERHRFARVMGDDEEGRELLADEAIRVAVPSLERFSAKHREKEFTKNPAKYIKMTPEEVKTQIRAMYR